VYVARKLHNSPFKEQLKQETVSSLEQADPHSETKKSGVENEAPKSDLNIENTKNKEEKGQDDNKSLQNNSPEENLPLNESGNQEESEKDALTNENQETLKSTDLESPGGEDESGKKEENKSQESELTAADRLLLAGKFVLVVLVITLCPPLLYILVSSLIMVIRNQATFSDAVKFQYNSLKLNLRKFFASFRPPLLPH